jgi:hypothetical protein
MDFMCFFAIVSHNTGYSFFFETAQHCRFRPEYLSAIPRQSVKGKAVLGEAFIEKFSPLTGETAP